MRLFIDECPSPNLAHHLNETGEHDAVHPRDRGRLGEPDHLILKPCITEQRAMVTENAIDFRKLAARVERPPGLIILPSASRDVSRDLLIAGLRHLANLGEPALMLANTVLEVNGLHDFKVAALRIAR